MMKRPSLKAIGIEEGEDSQIKGPQNIFNKIIEEKFPNLKKEMCLNVQEGYRTTSKLDQKRKTSHPLIINTLNVQYIEIILKAARGKGQATYEKIYTQFHNRL